MSLHPETPEEPAVEEAAIDEAVELDQPPQAPAETPIVRAGGHQVGMALELEP